MSDRPTTLRSISDTGMAVTFDADEEKYLVSPTTAAEKNTLRAGLFPVSCWRLDDPCFPFGSSFVVPEAQPEFTELALLMKERPGAPLSLFGHADPVGSEEFNKQLSGRRAEAVYAVLIRDTGIWAHLFDNPLGNDDWHDSVVPKIREVLKEQGTGDGTAATRADLFQRYMDWLCHYEDGSKFQITKADFLAQGADSGGKGDYQGCGEFNPVLIFSQADDNRYSNASDKTERDDANAPNRRVSALLFRPGTQVLPARWPCPRANESAAGCRKRFWSDSQQRVTPGAVKRQWEVTKDTFACRFYDRIAGDSPCERVAPNAVVIQFLYEDETPMADATFEAVFGEARISGSTDEKGTAVIETPEGWEGPFQVFLLEFPETYISAPSKQAEKKSGGDTTEGARYWPENTLSSIILTMLLAATTLWAAEPVTVTLQGPVYADGEPGQISMTLRLDPRNPSGTVEYPAGSADHRFTMTDMTLEVLDEQKAGVIERVRYRLRYAVNRCEHAEPVPREQPITRWDPCRFSPSEPRPRLLMSGEALLTRERSVDGESFVAAGVPDVRNLWGVYRATGRSAP
jgi:hypothetical protein